MIWYARQLSRIQRLLGLLAKLVNHVPGKEPGSKQRNLMSYYAILLCVVFCFDLYASYFDLRIVGGRVAAFAFCVISVLYFYLTTIGVVRLVSKEFQLSPGRLVRDIAISVVFSILAFSLLYRSLGIVPTFCKEGEVCAVTPVDHVYFSAVTFSTLGYGDFRPSADTRIWAAFQALFGNVHLGLIVGSFYLAIQVNERSDAQASKAAANPTKEATPTSK